MFEKIKKFYAMGLYTDAHIENFFKKGIITEKQKTEILVKNK